MLGLDETTRTLDGLKAGAAGWAGVEELLADNPATPIADADWAEIARTRDGLRRTVVAAERAGTLRPRTAQRLARAQSGAEVQALLLPLAWADDTRRDLTERLGAEVATRTMAADLAQRLLETTRRVRASSGLDADAGNALAGWAECAYAAGLLTEAQLDTLTGADWFAAQACAERFAAAALDH